MSAESAWERELRERLLEIFVAEAAERLAALDAALLALEGGASEADSHHLSEAFRQAHTLKGGARAAGLPDVERVSHGLESVFERLRRGAPGGPDTWGAIYAAVDAVRALVAGRGADVDTVVAALAVPGPAAPPPRAPPREPPASANGGGNGDGHPPSAPPVPSAAVGPAGTAPVPVGDTVRVPMARLEGLMAEVRELHVALSGLRQRAVDARALDKGTSRLGLVLRRRRRRPSAAPAPGAVPDDGLDFIDEMGGLRRRLDGDVRRLEQVAADLHDSVRRLRMVPVGVALAGIPRLVRDTATACGKQARIELLGESTEVDRSVLEGIGGALTHLVRNAVDHGLEEPDRRRRSGKPTIGRVTIDAREERGTLVLEVSDDGGGIDVEAVRRRGVELGLVSAEQAALAGLDLLFRPGFSTAGRITEVSGRGVGLDAVVSTVESLQGSVAVRTEDGAGSTFTLTLPLTLATTRSLVLRAAGRTVALPLAAVSRVVRVGAGDIGRSSGRAALIGSGGPVAVAELAAVLGFDRAPEPAGGNAAGPPSRLAVIAASGSISAAVLVDEIRGEEEIVINTLPAPLHRVRFTAGATILGTGEVVPVLHAGEVFRAVAGHRPAGPATAADDGPAPSHRRVVVVADDSVTTRTLERVILESAGYEVRTAADGGQALALVQAGGCDAVVSDVQMPVLDGFALCERLRADARYRDLPVVLVTARGSRSDQERGVAVGADAYIVKGEFDQENLLATLRRLL
ncbi:MAG: two-component system, chemotaxis family, sensor kinase CheA [Actinomycetota bacterium]|nr:two-component system, chemotaxis family, sensor kinase CheA [Actinomycetota bacterium]